MELNLDWRQRRSTVWPEVCYEIRPLRVWAFQELVAYWEAAGRDGTPPPADPAQAPGIRPGSLGAAARMMGVARRIFPDHVRNVTGLHLRAEGGTAVPDAAALCEEAPLLPLAAEIVAALVEISALDEGAEKN